MLCRYHARRDTRFTKAWRMESKSCIFNKLFTLAFEYISVLFVYEANKPQLCDDSSGSCGGSVKFEDHIIMLQDARHCGRRNYK